MRERHDPPQDAMYTRTLPDFSGGITGAMSAFLTLSTVEVSILPGLALQWRMAGLVHHSPIISAKQPARRFQQVSPLQTQQACNAGDPPLVQWLASVPTPWTCN